MPYRVINKSDTFLTFNVKGKKVQLEFGGSILVDDNDVTQELKYKASSGIINLIYELPKVKKPNINRTKTNKVDKEL